MRHDNISRMFKGWFVGSFSPSVFDTDQVEVGVKRYSQGTVEPRHYHKVATEITLILQGRVRMCDRVWHEGDIIVIEPYEQTAFEALEDTITVVVKLPGASNDKFITDHVD
jgi:quercetin dioxygenase-like cupin family protein